MITTAKMLKTSLSTNKFSYKIDKNWLPYLELQWLDRWNDYNREQYRIHFGDCGIRSNKKAAEQSAAFLAGRRMRLPG